MSDLTKLKIFVIRISRSLNENDLSKFGPQLFSFCYKKEIPISPKLHINSNFMELMDFAFKQNLITLDNTDLITQLLYSAERYDLSQELYYVEKKFTGVEKKSSSFIDLYAPISSHESYSTPTYKLPVIKQQKFKTSSKSDVSNLFSKRGAAMKNIFHRRTSESEKIEYSYAKGDYDNNVMLTDQQVVGYCSQISPDEWKQLAVIGFGLSSIEVERIDYDCRTIQDKTIAIFRVWKNQSFALPYYPPFTKQGLKQALIAAKLNGLIYRLFLQ